MRLLLSFAIASFVFTMLSCKDSTKPIEPETNSVIDTNAAAEILEIKISGHHKQSDSIMLRIAFIGDAEPKPLAEFPNMDATVQHINKLSESLFIDFVIGVGDIAHKGTEIQYEEATKVLQKLEAAFYPIMGNEEHGSTVERYLHYAQKWNSSITNKNYVLNHDTIAFVFASPDYSREFNDTGASWIIEQLQRLAPKPVVLIVHGAQAGVYPENPDKGINNKLFIDNAITQTNLVAVISGDLHMDMDRTNHSKKIGDVHYMHIPALERTKIPDESSHIPMFRVLSIGKNGKVWVDTYKTGSENPVPAHAYSFNIDF
jgi:3',5'-cyclic-AMP phosphodiesterase